MLNIIKEVLNEELKRVLYMQNCYLQEYENGLKGSVFVEKDKYVYLVQREVKKVKKIYLGKIEEVDIVSIKKSIAENKKHKQSYYELKNDEKKLRKAINCL